MFRCALLATAALATLAAPASAQTKMVNGGGSDDATYAYNAQFAVFNKANPTRPQMGPHLPAGSAAGVAAFLNNDLTCLTDALSGANGGACANQPGGANSVHYGTSDVPLTAGQIAAWPKLPAGQGVSGNLIEVPAMAMGVAIPVVNTRATANGAVVLSDNDLCGIFSGLISDFGQITDSARKLAPGPITVVYRGGPSGTTLLLTSHLAAVCNAANTEKGIQFVPAPDWHSIFNPITHGIPSWWLEVADDFGGANALAGLRLQGLNAIGYTLPEFTSLLPKDGILLSNGQPSPLVVAALSLNGKPVLPTTANIAAGLAHPLVGSHLTPPTNPTDAANPENWLPAVQVTSAGYPIVGYTAFMTEQCAADPEFGYILKLLVKLITTTPPYSPIQTSFGYQPTLMPFYKALVSTFVTNANGWNLNLGNARSCAGIGR